MHLIHKIRKSIILRCWPWF